MSEIIYLPVPGYPGYYGGSDGYVYSDKRRTFGMYRLIEDVYEGYLMVHVSLNGVSKSRFSHRLVAMAFHENSFGLPEVNHINTVKTDNRPENLEWCTGEYNIRHAKESGCFSRAKIEWSAAEMGMILDPQYTSVDLGKIFGVSTATICNVRKRQGVFIDLRKDGLRRVKGRICEVSGCNSKHHAYGYCRAHYYTIIQLPTYEKRQEAGGSIGPYEWISRTYAKRTAAT